MLLLLKKYHFIFQLTIVVVLACPPSATAEIIKITDVKEWTVPDCTIHYQARHDVVFCTEEWNEDKIKKPVVFSDCGKAWLAGYEERYYPFTNNKGFIDYFELSRWKASLRNGDGGVDVTGAPIELQVEGAGNLLVKKSPKSTIRLEIIIPANGYLSFSFSKSGGSIFIHTKVGDEVEEVAVDSTKSGSFLSHQLHTGDLFILEIENKAGFTEDVLLKEFKFLTNTLGVNERHWTAFNFEGNQLQFVQLIASVRNSFIDIIFPDNVQNVSGTSPKVTGYPLLDTDGVFYTTTDRIPIEKVCLFELDYKDELIKEDDKEILLRHWIVRDLKTQSTTKEIQKITFASSDSPPSSLSKKIKEEDNTMNSVKSKKGVGF